jgi:MFS family permease
MDLHESKGLPGSASRRAAVYGLSLLTLLNFVNYIDRSILSAVLGSIRAEFGLSHAAGGFIATAFLTAYFITSPIFGRLGDRLSRTRLMAVGVGVWSVATAGAGIARNYVQLLLSRAVVGVGEAAYASISPALISDYYPASRRGRAFAIFYVAIPVGMAVGYVLGGEIEYAFHSWRSVFFIVGLPGVLLALLTLTAPDPPRGIHDGLDERLPADEHASLRAVLVRLARNPVYIWTVLGYAAYTFAMGGLSVWAVNYFQEVRHLHEVEATRIVGGVLIASGLVGTFTGGYLGDWLAARVRHGYLWLSGVSMLASVPFGWVALTSENVVVYSSMLFIAEFLVFLSTGPINVVIVNVVPVAMRATAMAVSIFVIHLLGDLPSPTVLGIVADHAGFVNAALIMPVMLGVSGVIWTATAAWCKGGEPGVARGQRSA